MSKRPSFQFYPSDWRNDAGLRLCSVGARGLWVEMMCLMHDATPYGHLTVMGRPMEPASLARLVGEGMPAVKRWLAELETNDVFSRNDDGLIFSRRMVRDEEVRELRAAGGQAGAEHGKKGASHGSKGGRPRNDKPPLPDDGRGVSEPPPSSSSPSPSPPAEGSASNDAGGEPPIVDSDKAFWDGAKAYLGKSKASKIGQWVRDYGRDRTAAAIAQAQVERAVEPISYIEAVFKKPHLRAVGDEWVSPC